jgi:uncharacterized membrane protein YkvA (DUF1232 family)
MYPHAITENPVKLSWTKAYIRFLRSPEESLLLKIAPLVILGILPVDLLSNILPLVGLVDDVGLSGLSIVTIIRTIWKVNKYRSPGRHIQY